VRIRAFPIVLALMVVALPYGCGPSAGDGGVGELLDQAWLSFSSGDFDYSEARFRQVLADRVLADEQRHSALLGLATVYHLRSTPDLPKALEKYRELTALGTDEARRDGLLGMGLVGLSLATSESKGAEKLAGFVRDARESLAAVMASFPDTIQADEAALHLGQSYTIPYTTVENGVFAVPNAATVERGRKVLADWLARRPDNPLAASMHMTLGSIYIGRGDLAKASEHLIRCEELGIQAPRTREAVLLQIARIADHELKDYARAEKYYAIFVRDFRRSLYYYRATLDLGRVRKLIADQEG